MGICVTAWLSQVSQCNFCLYSTSVELKAHFSCYNIVLNLKFQINMMKMNISFKFHLSIKPDGCKQGG